MTACSGCRKLGYKGLLEANFSPLSARDVGGIIQQGGTIFRHRSLLGIEDPEVIQQAISALKNDSIDGLVVIGGRGPKLALPHWLPKHPRGGHCVNDR